MKALLTIFCFAASTASSEPWNINSIIQPNDLVHAGEISGSTAYEMSTGVARVESGAGYCSGMRVGKDLFMTNHHCHDFQPCAKTYFRMGFERNKPSSEQRVFGCREILLKDKYLDFALYRASGSGTDIFPIMTLSNTLPMQGQELVFASHAATGYKQIDISNQCVIAEANPYEAYDRINIGHTCDSMSGSSGAPLIDRMSGTVVGLHWGGTGNRTYNQAIPMVEILAFIEDKMPAVYQELSVQ